MSTSTNNPGATASTILHTADDLLGILAANARLPGPWGVVLAAAGAALGLAADLIDHAHDPVITITAMRSMVPDWRAAQGRLRDLIEQSAGKS